MGPNDPILDIEVARRKFTEAVALYEGRDRFAALGWDIREPRFPRLDVFFIAKGRRKIGVRLGLRNYDFQAASVTYLNPSGALFNGVIPATQHPQAKGPPIQRIVYVHPLTKLPFLCVEGTWEFHAHIQHQHKRWDEFRSQIRLLDVIGRAFDEVDEGWLRA